MRAHPAYYHRLSMLKVTAVAPESLGAELGLQVGTELLAINGREVEDFLDWEFLTADDQFLLHVRQPGGEELEYDIERPDDLAMGVSVEPPRIRRCANRCDFCFVDGLPEGLRETLYIRDDDYRLSFKYGNFATLTNLKPRDVARIIEYRLSPLYVSVHATDPVVRRWLLRNPLAPDILEQLKEFSAHGLEFHTQVVMSPGVNDGGVLEQTLSDLWALGPAVLSVSLVPVGLTTFSKHHLVREPTQEECREAVARLERWATRARKERGSSWALGADELYLRAGLPLPGTEWYDDFGQVENGVGAVRYLQRRIEEEHEALAPWSGRRIAVLTGMSMASLMPQVLAPLAAATGAHFELLPLTNSLFGETVTCAGLLPGSAFRQALRGRGDLDLALIPGESLNEDQIFMDDQSLEELRASAPVEVRPSYHFTDALVTPKGS
jgi:putative radical SAM enzyme (TIGR03279 family)